MLGDVNLYVTLWGKFETDLRDGKIYMIQTKQYDKDIGWTYVEEREHMWRIDE